MSALVMFVAPLVFSLFSAGVNFGVWFHRRSEHSHRALALASLSAAFLLIGPCLLLASDSRDEAIFARTLLSLACIPIEIRTVRLVERAYRVKLRWQAPVWVCTTLLWGALGALPGVLYGPGARERDMLFPGASYVDVELNWLGSAFPIVFAAYGIWLAWGAHRVAQARADSDSKLIGVVSFVSGATVVSDMLVLGGFIDAPLLYAFVAASASLLYTSLLLRRFVRGLGRVEASADLLQRAAESRAHELRETDLRLAHGARLAALGTLAAGLAHEINNPAAFIRSNLNYLDELAGQDRDDPELEEVLAETEEGVVRLRGIVDELLRMSRGDGGFGEVLLSDVVDGALPTLRFEARGDVAIEAKLAPVPPVRGDRNLLGQVVANLVINAIQSVRAAGAGGGVHIATFADDRRAVLEVSDTGPGVPPEVAQRIFEPFFTTKPAGQGTGLGLAVTRQLVERHGGRIALLPSERGARFQVELPLANPAPAPIVHGVDFSGS
ncbi:MAG TPA: HAMP domain-containing sensor histidine kinase [Myxococcota bacterium]|nr:HAMP domain-containing sensor histidine kinase [Myxococcota bacterium]